MTAKCHECGTDVSEPETTLAFPSVITLLGDKGVTARVAIYRCGCGHNFTTIDYVPKSPPPLKSKTEPIPRSSPA